MKKILLHIIGMILVLAGQAFAQESAVVFSRDVITIAPKKVVAIVKEPPPADAADAEKPAEPASEPAPRPEHRFYVEIRPASSQRDDGIFLQKPFSDGDGLLRVFDAPVETAQSAAHVYTPVDVVFLRADGTIVQIAPDILLAELTTPIAYDGPIRALLYLKAGICKKLDILPGDWVKHGIFVRSPDIIKESEQ